MSRGVKTGKNDFVIDLPGHVRLVMDRRRNADITFLLVGTPDQLRQTAADILTSLEKAIIAEENKPKLGRWGGLEALALAYRPKPKGHQHG